MPPDNTMSDDAYFSHPAISQSLLKLLARPGGPARVKAGAVHEQTEAQKFGRLIHEAILRPDVLETRYVEARHRVGSSGYRLQEGASLGKQLVAGQQLGEARAIAGAVRRWSSPARLLLDSLEQVEQAVFWTDPVTGVPCKAKLDGFSPRFGAIVDLKSTNEADEVNFGRACRQYGYAFQAAFYQRGWNATHTVSAPHFVIIAVEKTDPYLCACYEFDPLTMAAANAEIDRLLALYRRCADDAQWPAYPDYVQTLSL